MVMLSKLAPNDTKLNVITKNQYLKTQTVLKIYTFVYQFWRCIENICCFFSVKRNYILNCDFLNIFKGITETITKIFHIELRYYLYQLKIWIQTNFFLS